MALVGLGILILLYSFINFKKGFRLYLIYQIFWLSSAQLFTLGSFSVTMGLLTSATYLFLFWTKHPHFYRIKPSMPYSVPMLLIILSLLVTCFTGAAGFMTEFTRAISTGLQTYSTIFIAWYVIDKEKDFRYLIKGIIYVFFVAVVFAGIEYFLQSNFLISYKAALTATGNINIYTLANGRGYRILSIFEHSIGAGMAMGLFSIFIIAIVINKGYTIPKHKFAILIALLCLPCVVLTKMRSGILFTAVASLCLINFDNLKKKKTYKILFLIVIGLVLVWPMIAENIDLFRSFFDDSAQTAVGGSSATMRFTQLDAIVNIMKMSPIGGLGEKFTSFISNQYTAAALSYESLWFEQMVKHGLVGVAVNIVLVIYSVVVIPLRYKSKECFFISLAYFVTYTFSSVPSFRLELYYFVLFYFIKHSEAYQNKMDIDCKKILER